MLSDVTFHDLEANPDLNDDEVKDVLMRCLFAYQLVQVW